MCLIPVTLRNAVDSCTAQDHPTTNYFNTDRLRLRSGTGTINYAYLSFSWPFPLGCVITSAKLRVYAEGPTWGAQSRTMACKMITSQWQAGRMYYDNQPTVGATVDSITRSTAVVDGELWEFDVQTEMQEIADGTTYYGFRLELNDTTLRYLESSRSLQYKPTLQVTYSMPPSAPSTLSPSGGRSIVGGKPILRFDYSDDGGSSSLNAVQVQIDAANDFATPDFDSGSVTTSTPQLDLNATAYGGCTEGTTTYWRVRVKDISGQWSPWSAVASFARYARGSLSITTPTSTTGLPTPLVSWSFTGRTQAAYQVIITDSTGEHWLHTSGKITSTATSYTVPERIINDDTTYKCYVRIWDTVDREGVPTEPAFTEASQSFTWALSGSVTPVSNLTATMIGGGPGVRIQCTRATAPTTFVLLRDGVVQQANIEPADILVSGTTYAINDWSAAPRTTHTWQLRAVVGSNTSASNPTATLTTDFVGIWLSDPDRGLYVQLGGKDPGKWSMGEDATNYNPLGGTSTVRVTQALRGYEGSVSGVLITQGSDTLADAEADLFAMKAAPGRTYLLTLADLAMPVIIGNVVSNPTPHPEIIRQVSFDFWQVADIPFSASL